MEKITDWIPAILILISVMTISLVILFKYGKELFSKEYQTNNLLLWISGLLFIIVLIVHLFKEQTWTGDTLKVLIGIMVGSGATKASEKKTPLGNAVDISGQVGGDIAGGDINKTIQNIREAISDIQNSVVHQNNQINQLASDNTKTDYLINTIYERENNITGGLENVIQHWTGGGWTLKYFTSDYSGMDGLILIFTRPMLGTRPQIEYFHGSRMERQ